MKVKILSLVITFMAVFPFCVRGEDICERFNGDEKIAYKVYFNGIPSGKIEWHYLGKEDINGKYIFDELQKGNLQIKEIVDSWIEYIGKGLVSLTHIFNPEIILIGGGVSKQEKLFIEPLKDYVLSHVMKKFSEGLRVEAAELGNNAGLVGAVYYNINN